MANAAKYYGTGRRKNLSQEYILYLEKVILLLIKDPSMSISDWRL